MGEIVIAPVIRPQDLEPFFDCQIWTADQGLIRFIKENLDSAPYEEIAGKTTEYRSISRWLILACFPLWIWTACRFLKG